MLFRNALPQAYQACCAPSAVLLDTQPLPRALAAGARLGGWLAAPQAQELSRHSAARSFVTTRAAAQNILVSVLQDEAAFEQDDYAKPEALSKTPKPWKIVDTPGTCVIALTSKYQGENIRVEVDVDEQENDEEISEEAEEGQEPDAEEEQVDEVEDISVLFRVHVTKGDQALVFDCQSDGSYLTVLHAALEPADAEQDEQSYDGPVFSDLDEKLQAAFTVYLGERGVTEELGAYLVTLSEDKEQREYMHWLDNVTKFVKA
ncbi:hypothetical protein WJX73_008556 [Symbiochloris irregularis]|uniref:Mitochondrial glycoprotein n=1 Tax=Symbiochloris irregularis TaxID=706552 RepID=A0AAW1P0X9_9CHLO